MAKAPVLVDRFGQPLRREVLKEEIAGPTLTGVRSPFGGYPGDGLNPGRVASILKEADQGDPLRYLELAETIEERDHHYLGVLGTRKRSVAQLEITVEAASDDAPDVAFADMVRAWLMRDELQEELFNILDAIGKGFSETEIIWDSSEGQWRPARLEWRDPRWFRFDRKDGATPLLRTDTGDVPLPPFKFISAVIRAKSGLPIRSGLARLATWSWMFKAFTLRDWAVFVQTFGQPVRVGKYGPSATEKEKETLYQAVANIAADCAAIIPEGMAMEFIEAGTVGQSHQLYKERADWLDQQVSKAVLGQTATTDAIAGGHAVGQEHRQVQEDIERADARALSAILNRDLIQPWVMLEAGPQKSYPRLKIGRQEEKDIAGTVDAVTKLVPFGLRVAQSTMRDLVGLPDPGPDEELLAPPRQAETGNALDRLFKAPGGRQALQQEERARQDAIDRLAAEAEAVAAPAADRLIDAIRKLVDGATSLDDVRDGLLELAPAMPADELARLLGLALAYAELAGRSEIADQASSGA
jgi:phage gp29-like protein